MNMRTWDVTNFKLLQLAQIECLLSSSFEVPVGFGILQIIDSVPSSL